MRKQYPFLERIGRPLEASGPIYFFQRPDATISDAPAADIEAEKAIDQLNALADKAREETSQAAIDPDEITLSAFQSKLEK